MAPGSRPGNAARSPGDDNNSGMRHGLSPTIGLLPRPGGALCPPRLGNALRAAELQAGQRYGLNTIDVWPRLLPNLSPRVTEIITDLRNQLDTSARFCAVLVLATLASTALLAVHGPWLLIHTVTAVSSWIAYRAAVRCDRPRPSALRRLRLPIRAPTRSAPAAPGQFGYGRTS